MPLVPALLPMLALTACYGPAHTPSSRQSKAPATVSADTDHYALSPPPELILPRDEPLTGAWADGEAAPDSSSDTLKIGGDLWQRLRSGFNISRERHEIRDAARRLAAGRNHLNSTLQQGEPYLWHLMQEVEARELPMEIVLLPAIESAYNPYAYSPSHAVGLWQFIAGTGDRFGLRRNWWYDGRRDVTESTRAALDYLSYLHDMFDDWPLALAAYNCGEGRVLQAMEYNRTRGRPTDYWSIPLPAETRDYVPRLLGLAELLARPEDFGYELRPLSDEPSFEIVELPGQVELEIAAGLIDLDPGVLQKLNAGFSRWATDPQGPHRLLVPFGQGERLRNALAVLPQDSLVRWHRYIVEEGDSLSAIAQRHGIQAALLREVNRLADGTILAGTELRIPRAYARELRLPEDLHKAATLTSVNYVIRPGDSLWLIAKRHGVRVRDLARWNNLSPSATLHPGRTLVIHGGGPKTTDT